MSNPNEPKWTQDESVAFEAAVELIGHVMAIKSEQIEAALSTAVPDQAHIDALRAERSVLAQQRNNLHPSDTDAIARIRADLGATVRAQESHQQAA